MFRFLRRTAPDRNKLGPIGPMLTEEELAILRKEYSSDMNGIYNFFSEPKSISQWGGASNFLKNEKLRTVGYKKLNFADSLCDQTDDVEELHFYYPARGRFYYRWRNHDDFALDEAITSFEKQIDIAPRAAKHFQRRFIDTEHWTSLPAHEGYRQLRVIEEKRGNLEKARALCVQAKAQGWSDDWDHHIKRIDKKISARK